MQLVVGPGLLDSAIILQYSIIRLKTPDLHCTTQSQPLQHSKHDFSAGIQSFLQRQNSVTVLQSKPPILQITQAITPLPQSSSGTRRFENGPCFCT